MPSAALRKLHNLADHADCFGCVAHSPHLPSDNRMSTGSQQVGQANAALRTRIRARGQSPAAHRRPHRRRSRLPNERPVRRHTCARPWPLGATIATSRPPSLSWSSRACGTSGTAPLSRMASNGRLVRDPGLERTLHHLGASHVELAQGCAGALGEIRHRPPAPPPCRQACQQGRRVAGGAAHIQHRAVRLDLGQLHHLGKRARRQQRAGRPGSARPSSPAAPRPCRRSHACRRRERLARHLQHGPDDAPVGDVAGAHLAVDHIDALLRGVGHRHFGMARACPRSGAGPYPIGARAASTGARLHCSQSPQIRGARRRRPRHCHAGRLRDTCWAA